MEQKPKYEPPPSNSFFYIVGGWYPGVKAHSSLSEWDSFKDTHSDYYFFFFKETLTKMHKCALSLSYCQLFCWIPERRIKTGDGSAVVCCEFIIL